MAKSSPTKSSPSPASEDLTPDQLKAQEQQAAYESEQAALAHIRRVQNEAAREITLDRLATRDPAIAELLGNYRTALARIAELEAQLAAKG